MNLQDALLNWLQLALVAEARPGDEAARQGLEFFETVLREDHGVATVSIKNRDATFITVSFTSGSKTKTQLFAREDAELLLTSLASNPKYLEE